MKKKKVFKGTLLTPFDYGHNGDNIKKNLEKIGKKLGLSKI